MKKNIIAIIGVIIVIVLNALVFAGQRSQEKSTFAIVAANQSFEALQKKLETQHDYNSLVFYVHKLENIYVNSKECADNAQSHLKMIDELLKSTQLDVSTPLQRADLTYLKGKQVHYGQELSECRLLSYRSREMLITYKDRMQALSTNQILQKNTPIWKLTRDHWINAFDGIDWPAVLKLTGVSLITQNQWVSVIAILILGALVGLYLSRILTRFSSMTHQSYPLWEGFLLVLARFITPCIVVGIFSLFLNMLFEEIYPTPTLELMSHASLLLVLGMAMLRYLFFPCDAHRGLLGVEIDHGRHFYWRTNALLWLLFLGYIVSMMFRDQSLPPSFVELSRTLFLTIVSIVAAWVFVLFYRAPLMRGVRHSSLSVFSSAFIATITILIVVEWVGYHRLVIYVIQGLGLSIASTIAAIVAWRLVNGIYEFLDNTQYASARRVHHWLGVKHHKQLSELIIVRVAAHFVILCFYLIFLLKSWNVSPVLVDATIDSLLNGFKFFSINIFPLRLALGCLVFAVLFMAGRVFSASLSNKDEFKGEENTQIAVSTITIYIAFVIALFFGMLVTGIDLTGLAIVAGALSVGVGLGMQNIVNNFVSGLILLIEKPIKPGDRVIIGKTEGFVRKIRIRSTQIATMSKEDVIVPNADFITQQVTNCMFRDRYSRISCQVGVAYGSDVHLVKKVLLGVAAKHVDVVQEAPNAPIVLFSKFGESCLVFDLLCVIYDVNKKSIVVSDLNFEIEAAFRENKIEIPFPQSEVRIKQN